MDEISAVRSGVASCQQVKLKFRKEHMKETINNDAYSNRCNCPVCNKRLFRGSEDRIFYCENCGTQLHQRAFTREEIKEAIFQHEMDEYED